MTWNGFQIIHNEYCGKRAFFQYHKYKILLYLGLYQKYKQIKWGQVERLVFVCMGNICRSPYAEAKARLLGFPSISFGLRANNNSPAHPYAKNYSAARGVNIDNHVSKNWESLQIQNTDLLVAMEPWQGKELEALAESSNAQITLLGLWCSRPTPYIRDPYSCNETYFNKCFSMLDDCLSGLTKQLR